MSSNMNSNNSNAAGAGTVDADVIDADVIDNNAGNEQSDWAERAPFTAAFLKQFDTARNKLTTQLEAGQKSVDDLQQKARELVSQVQNRAGKVSEKVREEGKEASTKLDGLRRDLGNKFPLKIDLESWLNLPLEAREEVLSALGIATDKQVSNLQFSVDKLREESIVLVEAQTAVLKEIIERNGAVNAKPAAGKPANRRPANRKPRATSAAAKAPRKTATKTATKRAPRKPTASKTASAKVAKA